MKTVLKILIMILLAESYIISHLLIFKKEKPDSPEYLIEENIIFETAENDFFKEAGAGLKYYWEDD